MVQPFRLIGSLRVAVTLLIVIAGVLAWGTIYETRFGTAAVQRFVYQSWWFQGILAFLAVNLATAAFLRYPWKRKHLPFLLAHIGIIMILTGGILGGRLGVEGQLIIPEGKSNDTLQLDRNVLVIHQPNPGIHREFLTRFETTAWNHAPHALFEVPLGKGSLQVVVDRYYPDAVGSETILPEGEKENPAVLLELSDGDHRGENWLFCRDPDRFGAHWGGAHVFFLELDTEAAWKRALKKEKSPHALPPNGIVLLQGPGGKLAAILTGPNGERKIIPSVRIGAGVRHPQLGYGLRVKEHWPRAQIVRDFSNRSNEVRSEALHLIARQGDRTAQAWLGLRESAALAVGEHPVVAEYRPAVRQLPFSVKLLDFRKIDYPGTEMAAAFESDVELNDPERGISFKKKISMNNPLKHRGYSLFQSSFVLDPVETTVLSVRKDPGVPLVYAGFLIVLAGVTTLFTSKSRKSKI